MSSDGANPPTPRRRKRAWSESVGPYGHRVRVYEDLTSGILYGEMRDVQRPGGYRCVSLRHRDREKAIAWAHQQVNDWLQRGEQAQTAKPVLSRILPLYLQHCSPKKASSEQQADQRRGRLWTRFLGSEKDLSRLTLQEWQTFIAQRTAGVIDAEGLQKPEREKLRRKRIEDRPVRAGTVWADLVFLASVINWACRWRTSAGHYLMAENPARGFPLPVDRNPRRPVATQDRFEKVRAVAEQVTVAIGQGKKRRDLPSYLPEILDIVAGTGRRISAVLALRYSDLQLDSGPPLGAIRWPANTDKGRKEWTVPINAQVRAAVDRVLAERPGIGAAHLFPSPGDPAKPVSKELASAWLRKAEELAKVPKQDGSLWHAYRRGWATARKHLPVQDVMAAGGWSEPSTLQMCYQQADPETMFRVVSEPVSLRKVQRG